MIGVTHGTIALDNDNDNIYIDTMIATDYILTPICYYQPDPDGELDIRCAVCGHRVQYTHEFRRRDGGESIGVGRCCAARMRKDGAGKDPRNGYYDWKLSAVREDAYWDWYCSSLSHAV